MTRIVKRLLIALALFIVALLVVGVAWEQWSRRAFDATRPPADEFIEVDGRQIHFVKRGTGGPTVVFQSGLGGDWRIWQEVQGPVAERTTTLSYDRAGILWSAPYEGAKTLESMDAELLALLEQTNCPKPYVLVGHSIAGITLRTFIAQHRADIAGVVFVDTTPIDLPAWVSGLPEELRSHFAPPPRALVMAGVQTGLLRALWSVKPFSNAFPAEHWFNRHVRDSFSKSWKGILQEAEDDDAWFGPAARVHSFDGVPFVVIAAAYPNGVDYLPDEPALIAKFLDYHRASQESLLRLSTDSRLVSATKSDHYVPLHEPGLIVDAIVSLLDETKSPEPSKPPGSRAKGGHKQESAR